MKAGTPQHSTPKAVTHVAYGRNRYCGGEIDVTFEIEAIEY